MSTSYVCGCAIAMIRLLPMTVETVRKGNASALSLGVCVAVCVSFIKQKKSVFARY